MSHTRQWVCGTQPWAELSPEAGQASRVPLRGTDSAANRGQDSDARGMWAGPRQTAGSGDCGLDGGAAGHPWEVTAGWVLGLGGAASEFLRGSQDTGFLCEVTQFSWYQENLSPGRAQLEDGQRLALD